MNTNGILQQKNSETLQCHKNTQDLFIVCWGICAIRLFVGGNVDDCFSCPFMLYKVNYILLIINIIKIIFISKVEKSCFVFFNMLLFKDHNPQHFSVTLNYPAIICLCRSIELRLKT